MIDCYYRVLFFIITFMFYYYFYFLKALFFVFTVKSILVTTRTKKIDKLCSLKKQIMIRHSSECERRQRSVR